MKPRLITGVEAGGGMPSREGISALFWRMVQAPQCTRRMGEPPCSLSALLRMAGAVRMEGSIGSGQGRFCGELSLSRVRLELTWQEDVIEADIAVQMWPVGLAAARRLPDGAGEIRLNGAAIATYRGQGGLIMNTGRKNTLALLPDTTVRRYCWARRHGLSWWKSLLYACQRLYVLASDTWMLASFAGALGRASMLNKADADLAKSLSIDEQAAIAALGYLWNMCAPYADAFSSLPSAEAFFGSDVANIPSFSTDDTTGKWTTDLPAPARRGLWGRLLRFFVVRCDWLPVVAGLLVASSAALALPELLEHLRTGCGTRSDVLSKAGFQFLFALGCMAYYVGWRFILRLLTPRPFSAESTLWPTGSE